MAVVSNKMKLRITKGKPEEFITAEQYLADAEAESGLNISVVRKLFGAVKAGEEIDIDEQFESPKARKRATALIEKIEGDLDIHNKNKEKWEKMEEERKENEKRERERKKEEEGKDKERLSQSFSLKVSSPALLKTREEIVEQAEEAALDFLGKKLTIVDDELIVKKGENLTDDEIAAAFANLVSINKASEKIESITSKREAQLAVIAEAQMGERWINLFSSSPKDVRRIKNNMRTIKYVNQIGDDAKYLLKNLPISSLGHALTFRVATKETEGSKEAAEEKNLEARKEIVRRLKALFEKAEESGNKVSQIQIQNLLAEYKKEVGIQNAKIRYKFFYLVPDGDEVRFVGTTKFDERLSQASSATIDTNGYVFVWNRDQLEKHPITGVTEDIQDIVDRMVPEEHEPEKNKRVKKGKEEPSKPSKRAVVEEDEDEEEEEEEVKPAPKKRNPIVLEEDDDEDSVSDDDDDV